jgi:hypothetical protein
MHLAGEAADGVMYLYRIHSALRQHNWPHNVGIFSAKSVSAKVCNTSWASVSVCS